MTVEIREFKINYHWKCRVCGYTTPTYAKDLDAFCCHKEMLLLQGSAPKEKE